MEIEAKLTTRSRRALAAIARRRRLGRYRLTPIGVRELETLYLDTPEFDLMRAGVALRIRRAGADYELTVKRKGRSSRGVHHRPETTWRLHAMPRLPLSLRRRELAGIARLAGARPVVPLVGTRIRRSAIMVVRRGGVAPVAEIACDEVRFFRSDASRGSRASDPTYEVEVELLGGDERDLRAIVREIRARYPLRASSGSKLERALRWAGVRPPRVRGAS
jgi:inorganic triphosphatase YgiF